MPTAATRTALMGEADGIWHTSLVALRTRPPSRVMSRGGRGSDGGRTESGRSERTRSSPPIRVLRDQNTSSTGYPRKRTALEQPRRQALTLRDQLGLHGGLQRVSNERHRRDLGNGSGAIMAQKARSRVTTPISSRGRLRLGADRRRRGALCRTARG